MSCCNNIYPECDKERWEVSNSIQLADADNYYTKKIIDEKLSGITTDGISEDEASELIDEALLDYYTKDEVDAGFNTINLELDKKLDATAYTPTDLTDYATKEWVEDKGYLTEHQHLKTINNISLIGDGNIEIGTGGTIDLSNYYTRAEVDDKLDLKANASDLSALNADVEGLSISLENKADKSDIPSLADYYSKSQVDALIATLQNKIDALKAQLEECCSGGGGEDTGTTEGTRYTLYLNDGTTVTGSCIVNGKPYYQIDGDWVHSQETDRFHTDEDLSAVTSVKLGECAHGTNGSAFGGFTNMTSITVTDNFAVIGHSSFGSCSSLLDIPHSEGLETIGDYAFGHCNSLTDITLPSTVTSIGQWAFVNCTGLTSVTIEATTPPTLGDWAFYNEYGTEQLNITIYVPAESVEAYKAASGWSTYANRIFAMP